MITEKITELNLNQIDPEAIKITNIRTQNTETKEDTNTLIKSIKSKGQIYPVLVRKLKEEEKIGEAEYGIIDGHRRYYALSELAKNTQEKYHTIKVQEITATDEKQIAFIANNARKQMEELEKAEIVYNMHHDEDKSFQEIANELGFSKPYANKLEKMWLNRDKIINKDVNNDTTPKPEFNYSMTKSLTGIIYEQIEGLNETTETTQKLALRKNMQEVIQQLQLKIADINKFEDVKKAIAKQKAENLEQARLKMKVEREEQERLDVLNNPPAEPIEPPIVPEPTKRKRDKKDKVISISELK